jgi:hypothetical protein
MFKISTNAFRAKRTDSPPFWKEDFTIAPFSCFSCREQKFYLSKKKKEKVERKFERNRKIFHCRSPFFFFYDFYEPEDSRRP